MFIHFWINTFHDQKWTDDSKPASSYQPTAMDAEQWIRVAKEAGMKYVILTAKHHEGFCLWDSKYTEYDVASSGNKTNVIEAVAKACEKYDIGLGERELPLTGKRNLSDNQIAAAGLPGRH